MDVGNGVLQFERTILSSTVTPVDPEHVASTDPYDLFVFEIKGLAFLYHQVETPSSHPGCEGPDSRMTSCSVPLQVRCMMAVLLLIGQKLEAPEIINQLMDVQNNPRKPQYR